MPRFVHAVLLALALSACAGAPTGDREKMLAALQASEDAWNRGDLKGHLAIYDESVTAMTKNGPRPGANAALMTGRFVLSGGGEPEQSGWFTLVWQHTATGWKVIHDHSS